MALSLSTLSTAALERALELRRQIDHLQNQLDGIITGNGRVGRPRGRAASVAAPKQSRRGRRKMSAAARAAIPARAKLRWKKAKAAGRSHL